MKALYISSISTTTSSGKIHIPDYWREEAEDCIDEGVLEDSSQSDLVHTSVTPLVAKFGPRPERARCGELGWQLTLKYLIIKGMIFQVGSPCVLSLRLERMVPGSDCCILSRFGAVRVDSLRLKWTATFDQATRVSASHFVQDCLLCPDHC